MTDHSMKAPKFYSRRFKTKCDQLLNDFYGISERQIQITADNYKQVYTFILQNYWWIDNYKSLI